MLGGTQLPRQLGRGGGGGGGGGELTCLGNWVPRTQKKGGTELTLGNFGQYWAKLGNIGQNWAIMGTIEQLWALCGKMADNHASYLTPHWSVCSI